jgi:indole-3-glycerol phosphate synthase
MSVLDEIFANTRLEVESRRRTRPLAQVCREAESAVPSLDFAAALRSHRPGIPALIAEVKCASPSRGLLAHDFDPLRLARIYQENGASAISVLTDERYFKGHLDYLRQIAQISPRLPLLRKDFIFDPYQVYEARSAGADAVLLIAAHLDPSALRDLHVLIRELGMTPLVEVHSRAELDSVLPCQPVLIGVNNRDLRDFTVRLETTISLRPYVPAGVCLVAESGIHTPADIARLGSAGVDAILVGEALVTAPDVAAKVRELSNKECAQ